MWKSGYGVIDDKFHLILMSHICMGWKYRLLVTVIRIIEYFQNGIRFISDQVAARLIDLLNVIGTQLSRGFIVSRIKRRLKNKQYEIEDRGKDRSRTVVSGRVDQVTSPPEVWKSAFYRRFNHYVPLWALMIAALIIDTMAFSALSSTTYGLAFRVAGALIIARGLFQSSGDIVSNSIPMPPVRTESGDTVDPRELMERCHRAVDAVFGASFIISGFVIYVISI
jgi:hypothetical protein